MTSIGIVVPLSASQLIARGFSDMISHYHSCPRALGFEGGTSALARSLSLRRLLAAAKAAVNTAIAEQEELACS